MHERPQDIIAVPDAVQASRAYRALTTVRDRLPAMIGESRLADLGRYTTNAVTKAWFYRWLTNEPEPEVIVIDLRETWTVGPIIAILDWVIELLAVAYPASRVHQFSTAVQRRLYRAPVRFVSALLLAVFLPITLFEAVQTGVSTTTVGLLVLTVGSGVGTLVDLSWPELRETRLVKLLIAALEPPEPPERDG